MGKGIDLSMDAFIDENELFSPSVEEENDANEQPEALEDLGLEDTKKDSADEEIDPNNIFGTSQEEVGGEDDDNDIHQGQETEDASSDNDDKSGSNSPESTQFYSTILSSLRDDGILPDIDEDLIKTAKTPEDFATAIEKQVAARLDETQRRIKEALDNNEKISNTQYCFNTIDAKQLAPVIQMSAVFINPKFENGFERANNIIDYYFKNMENTVIIKNKKDIQYVIEQKKIGIILTIENGKAIESDLNNIDKLYEKGIRLMSINWKKSDERLYSCPATTNICFESTISVSLSRYTQL